LGLFHTIDINSGRLAIWHAEEDVAFFRNHLNIYPMEETEIKELHGRKLKEWYSSRFLLNEIMPCPVRPACIKDEYGKPYLLTSDKKISISHSGEYAAVIISELDSGIDIQMIVPKISRIAPKFIEDEAWNFIPEFDNILYLHAIWGAKECMYKAYGRRRLDFRRDMKIKPFVFDAEGFYFEGSVQKDNYFKRFTLFCKQIDTLILVYAIEII